MVICLERGADLHTARLMPLPLTVSCFSKIQIGFTFLVLAHLGSPRKGPLNGCVLYFIKFDDGHFTVNHLYDCAFFLHVMTLLCYIFAYERKVVQ